MKILNIAVTGLKGSGKTSVVQKIQQHVELETEIINVYSYKSGDTLVYLSDTAYDINKIKPTLSLLNQADACLICISAIDGINQALGELILLLNFSNIQSGVVALTKTDSADSDQLASLKTKIKTIFAQIHIKDVQIVETSTLTDEGFLEVKEELDKLMPKHRDKNGLLKMPIDSSKEVKSGFTTVTGVIEKGQMKKHDKIIFMPWGKEFIVQEIQSHGHVIEHAEAGNRCAVAFKGLYPWDVQLGDLVAAENSIKKAKQLDLSLEITPFFKDEIKPGMEVELNIGAQTLPVTINSIKKDGADVQKLGSGDKGELIVESKIPFAFEEHQSCIMINSQAHWRSIKVVGHGKVKGSIG
jgi:selenocysteine-specific elongation factor